MPAAALLAAVAALLPAAACGQMLDRVVASVGNTAITSSDVKREYRLELLLDGKSVAAADPDTSTLKQVRERMIDRVLLEEEARASEIMVAVNDPSVDQRLDEIRKKFPNAAAYHDDLNVLGITEADLRQDLAEEETIMQLVDQRLRPEATVDAPEIEAYYQNTFVPEASRQGQHPPPVAEVTDRIREILVQQKINGLLEDWLRRLRAARDVRTYGNAEAEGMPQREPHN